MVKLHLQRTEIIKKKRIIFTKLKGLKKKNNELHLQS